MILNRLVGRKFSVHFLKRADISRKKSKVNLSHMHKSNTIHARGRGIIFGLK